MSVPARIRPRTGGGRQGLAVQARAILEKNCAQCHSVTKAAGKLDVRDYQTLIATGKRKTYVVPRDLEKSYLYRRVADGEMPPDGELSKADKEVLKRWIEAAAPAPEGVANSKRPFVGIKEVLGAILNYLRDAEEEDRPYLRFFTLEHLHNNPAIDDAKLARFRAALSKVLNGMHWKAAVVIPRQVDRQGTVFAIDLRELDWDRPSSCRRSPSRARRCSSASRCS